MGEQEAEAGARVHQARCRFGSVPLVTWGGQAWGLPWTIGDSWWLLVTYSSPISKTRLSFETKATFRQISKAEGHCSAFFLTLWDGVSAPCPLRSP